ncbi:MAG: hypothetical protein QNI84_14110 [Henriciella sp.]|nr:hypothetical protein [Henriciella sp.]
MKYLSISLLLAATALSPIQGASAQLFSRKPNLEVTYVVVSKSEGLYPASDKPIVDAAFVHTLQNEIENTSGDRRRNHRIQIVKTTDATNAVFSGSAYELERDGGFIFSQIQGFDRRCNDLGRTYANISRDIAIHGYESIRIVHIGPFVDVPSPCDNVTSVHVPQTVSAGIQLATILSEAERADFSAMMVHRDQYAPLWDYLNEDKISELKYHTVEILRPDETRTRINFTAQRAAPQTGVEQ